MSNIPAAGLTISAVAARTGVSVSVLRAWEQRFGFPVPDRLPGGHRRYPEAEVERIRRVVAERAQGRSLEAAIGLVTLAATRDTTGPTVFAGLRRARPDLPTHVIGRRTMLALSLAIEHECCAQAEQPHLAAAFQREEVYRRAQHRWDGLTRTAAASLVFAQFRRSRTTATGVREVAIAATSPLQREWSVVCDAPGSAAMLAGWERPDGQFEAMWSVEPEVVRLATQTARRLAAEQAPRLSLPDSPPVATWAEDPAQTLRRATAVTNRVVAHLDRLPLLGLGRPSDSRRG